MLRNKIGGMIFERTAPSRKPKVVARQELTRTSRDGSTYTRSWLSRNNH